MSLEFDFRQIDRARNDQLCESSGTTCQVDFEVTRFARSDVSPQWRQPAEGKPVDAEEERVESAGRHHRVQHPLEQTSNLENNREF